MHRNPARNAVLETENKPRIKKMYEQRSETNPRKMHYPRKMYVVTQDQWTQLRAIEK